MEFVAIVVMPIIFEMTGGLYQHYGVTLLTSTWLPPSKWIWL
jgi:hypothetical protein